jgi:hypothetical protein
MDALASPRPTVCLTLVGGDAVLLDIARDAYFCLPGAAGAWRALQAGDVSREARQLADVLAGAGYLRRDTPRETRRATPRRDLRDLAWPKVRAADVWRLGRAWLDYLRHYRGRPFAHLLRYATNDRPSGGGPDVARAARVFERLAVWLPVSGKCLVRSFLLLRFLHHSGHSAEWVFGVAVWPFKAHCWVEADGVALDDAPERLVAYVPILAA